MCLSMWIMSLWLEMLPLLLIALSRTRALAFIWRTWVFLIIFLALSLPEMLLAYVSIHTNIQWISFFKPISLGLNLPLLWLNRIIYLPRIRPNSFLLLINTTDRLVVWFISLSIEQNLLTLWTFWHGLRKNSTLGIGMQLFALFDTWNLVRDKAFFSVLLVFSPWPATVTLTGQATLRHAALSLSISFSLVILLSPRKLRSNPRFLAPPKK